MASLAPDITESLPAALAARETSQALAMAGAKWDINIGGIGFILEATDANPYQRQSVAPVKDQVDTSQEAGEQSLSGYWLRSQTSWHKGSGGNFYEPGVDETSQYRSAGSVGVDVWTEGEARLLRATSRINAQPAGGVAQFVTYAFGFLFLTDAGVVKRYKASGSSWVLDATLTTAKSAVGAVVPCGTALAVGTDTGVEICTNPTTGTTFGVQWTSTLTGGWGVWWAKDRLVAARGPALRELSLAGGDAGAAVPFYTHADPSWTWAAVCEAGTAILGAGRSGGDTAVYSFTLVDSGSGGSPTLGAPAKVAVLPPGELIYSMATYLGSYIGLGTSRGVRVGMVDTSGALQYGPLTVTSTQPVRCLAGADRFLYAGVTGQIDGQSGAVRVDVSAPVEGLRFGWAWDAQVHNTGEVTGIALTPDADPRVNLAVTGQGVFAQSATAYETSGYLLSGKVRYNTVEPKSFEKADVRADTPGGTHVVFSVLDDNNQENTIYTLGAGSSGRNINLLYPQGVVEYVQVRLSLTGDGASTPVVYSWQLKATPKPPSQWRIRFPLLCADRERTATGVSFGREGFAWQRVSALEALQNEAATVLCQDFTNGESFNGIIEQVDFTRPAPRSTNGRGNFGGVLFVTVRKVAA